MKAGKVSYTPTRSPRQIDANFLSSTRQGGSQGGRQGEREEGRQAGREEGRQAGREGEKRAQFQISRNAVTFTKFDQKCKKLYDFLKKTLLGGRKIEFCIGGSKNCPNKL